MVKTNSDQLSEMRARNKIDDAQKLAGERLTMLFEQREEDGLRAIDYSSIKVDTSMTDRSPSLAAMSARGQLRHIEARIGWRKFDLLKRVLADGQSPSDLADKRENGRPHDAQVYFFTRSLCDALDDLIDAFSAAPVKKRKDFAHSNV